ncbi:unnamed protein product [Caenorhabditis bovis]|uniref:Uncharacterized protein n=1 Tax=Caenorhabditis bovis TaxID=2654633 RepID=A0A8S1EIV6_9PELO|nr:unnamed protein product [Caenorhabditis bovis]
MFADAHCPPNRIVVDSFLTIASDDYLTQDVNEGDLCQIEIDTRNKESLLVSITNFLIFSHRRPKNTKEIVISNEDATFIVDNKPKGYQYLRTPILLNIPMNLNFRSVLMFSRPSECDEESMKCPSLDIGPNTTELCFPKFLSCDGLDTCGEDESNCPASQPKILLSSYKYGREALSSSQIMLIWFFALNGSFILFFLILSLCSVGLLFGKCPIYMKKNQSSRHTFIRYLREAIPPAPPVDKPVQPPPVESLQPAPNNIRSRHSILSRISFLPAPALQELEPEVEDREESPTESICSPPAHRPEVFLRRQSISLGENLCQKNNKFRNTGRAMSFQQ